MASPMALAAHLSLLRLCGCAAVQVIGYTTTTLPAAEFDRFGPACTLGLTQCLGTCCAIAT